MITIATHAARRSSETSETSAEVTSSLSASGSISFPNVVTSLLRRAIQPSSASVKLAITKTIAASRSPVSMPDSSAAASTGISRIRRTVSRFGTVGSNTRRSMVGRMPFSAEELAPTLRPLLEASQLPPRAFTDEAVATWELQHLFLGGWVCLGHAGALEGRGAFLTRELGGESVLAVAGDDGAPRAFHN